MFSLFKDKKIEKIAAVIDKEFESILKLANKYKQNIKLSDFKKEYKSKKLKHGDHPTFPSYKIVEWLVDIDDDIVPFRFFAEIQEGIVTAVRFDECPNYYGLEGDVSYYPGYEKWGQVRVGLAKTHEPDAMKLKKFIIKNYKYEDMKIINPDLWV